MENAAKTEPRKRRGAGVIRVALGAYFMAFGAGLTPGKDVRALTTHIVDAPYDALVAGLLICPIAFLVVMGRLYVPALIALVAAFVAVSTPSFPSYPLEFGEPVWVDLSLLAAMIFAVFLGQPDRRHTNLNHRREPGAPAQVTHMASPAIGSKLLAQPSIRLRRGADPAPQGKGLNIFREEFLGN